MPQSEEKVTLEQVLKLVDKLSPEEQEKLRRILSDINWKNEWDDQIASGAKDESKDNPSPSR